jgi:hypothetical protein
MAEAVRECEAAREAATDEETRQQLVAELGHTHRQFGDLLARSASEDAEGAPAREVFSAEVFTSLGDGALHSRTGAELAAGRLEADLGRPADATARARAVLAAYEGHGDAEATDENGEAVRARRAEAEQLLRLVAERPD